MNTHPHVQLIERFYSALGRRDAAGMAACYHPEVHFSDEVFPDLRGPRAALMWRMLCERGKDLRVEFHDVTADDARGRGRCEAWYTFTATGRPVHNQLHGEFEFKGGLIVRHRDRFDFWRWSRQALGIPGLLFGWTDALKQKVRAQAAAGLDKYAARSGS